jgi:quercetin dioxygenase-like cupin family protein
MKIRLTAFALLSAGALTALAMTPEPMGEHKLLAPGDVKWGPGPASLPPGAEAAILYGDPTKEGLFAMRLKFPKGYRIAPHTHPKPEIVTVIAGTFRLGMGDSADLSKAKALTAGGFIAMSPGQAHYAGADEETIVQLNSTGPWAVTYVNPKDDPRKKTR